MSDRSSHLLVWDSDADPPSGEVVCSWNGYSESGQLTSLLRHVDEHADEIRERYLSWVDDLGMSCVGRRRVVDRLKVGGTGFSIWWMTSVFEKSFVDAPTMARMARIFALDAILEERSPSKVLLVSDLPEVRRSIRRLCRLHGISFRVRRAGEEAVGVRMRRLAGRVLPAPLRAGWALLRFFIQSRPAPKSRPTRWHDGPDSILMVSCFGQMTVEEVMAGEFETRYWAGLRGVLEDEGMMPNWLHYFVSSPSVPALAEAVDLLGRIESKSDGREAHALLESYLTRRAVLRVAVRWLRLVPSTIALRALGGRSFGPSIHSVLWPLACRQWRDDLRGARSVHNLVWLGLFYAACADLPRQNRGIYLCEGASWEHAFIHAWRANGHGELIGVPHTTVHHWDVRYLNYAEGRGAEGPLALQKPDRLVKNNVTAGVAFEAMGLDSRSIVECESLRYNYLLGLPASAPEERAFPLSVLVLGEMRRSVTVAMLSQLAEVVGHIDMSVTLKPHPISPIGLGMFPTLNLQTVDRPLAEVLPAFDVAIASHATTAGVEAYVAGLRVLIWLDPRDLNLSDLRGMVGVNFVSGPEDLARELGDAVPTDTRSSAPSEFFCLDAGLPRWRRLLAERSVWERSG